MLGTVFADSELYKTMEAGGPVYDTLVLSQEKMLEMTADRDFVFDIASQQAGRGAARRGERMERSCSRSDGQKEGTSLRFDARGCALAGGRAGVRARVGGRAGKADECVRVSAPPHRHVR